MGVDTRNDTRHVAIEVMDGGWIGDACLPVAVQGYERLPAWMRGFGRLRAVGVEGAAS